MLREQVYKKGWVSKSILVLDPFINLLL
uniref:Uncharacterized protein n=1 Tax=Anguilla anguilla TaxID=7936 RepID=A0A0E9TI35_ANGAN